MPGPSDTTGVGDVGGADPGLGDVGGGPGRTVPSEAVDDPQWLDEEERAAWLSLLRVTARLRPLLDAQLGRDSGLNLFGYSILAMLSEQPGLALRMRRLAELTNVSPSRLSHAVRALEERGYVTRCPDPEDGRGTMAVLSPGGLGAVVGAAPGHVAAVRHLFLDSLTPCQLRQLREANEQILERVDPGGTTRPEHRRDAMDGP